MARRTDVSLELNIEDRQAQRSLEKTAKAMRDLGDDTEDTRAAGEAMAAAIHQSADNMIAEIDATARAAVRMHEALGEDSDLDAREVVADLKRMGLTAEQVEANAEQLAGALNRVGDVRVHAAERGFDNLDQAVSGVGDEVGRTRDTMTGFIGGTVGELPGITGALGPVAEGLGQLTEGAIEGQIGFKSLIGAGVGMAAVGLVVQQITKAFERQAEVEAFKREQVDAYTDALQETDSVLDAVNEKLRDARDVTVHLGPGLKVSGDDMNEVFVTAGLNVDRFARLVESGDDAIDEWASAMRDAGVDTDYVAIAAAAARQEHDALTEAQEANALAVEFFGAQTGEARDRVAEASEALTEHADKLRDSAAAYHEQIDAQLAAVNATFALRDAEDAFAKAVDESGDKLTAAGDDLRARQQVLDDVAQAAGRVAAAEIGQAEETAAAAGATLTATEQQDLMNASLIRTARQASGESRRAVIEYIAAVNKIPDDVATDIAVAVEQGDLDEAERLLNDTSRTRRTAVHADAHTADAERALNHAARDRNVRFRVNIPNGANIPDWYSKGSQGTRPADMQVVNEQGPELIRLPTGSQVMTAARTREIRAEQQSAGPVTIINAPQSYRPADIDALNRRYRRRNGNRP